ncbi:MAG TPA: ribosome small subunit-dependent GTPase A [Anaerolineaceae bacterium]|nr:ribosome small subunit-dependent GTPase A [Anaerolineaceae bacterium]
MTSELISGLVIRMQAGFFTVKTEDRLLLCQLRGRIKQNRKLEDLVAIGDQVIVSALNEKEGVIEDIQPREHALVRMAPTTRGDYKQILVANADQAVFVFSCTDPDPSLRMLDRFLVIAEKQQITPIIVANKVDLMNQMDAEQIFSNYTDIGYPVLYTSANGRVGIELLREQLQGKISAFAGPSGVGKTSLLNALRPGLGLEVRTLKKSSQKGRHTTTVRQLFPLDEDSYVADLPGIRQLSIWDVEPEELDGYFCEFRSSVEKCQFSNCSHDQEPQCGIKAAVENGEISQARYDSYLRLREELETSHLY